MFKGILWTILLALAWGWIPQGAAAAQAADQDAWTAETYVVDDHPLLLYKLINWWYHCLPHEAHQPCGRSLTCRNREIHTTWNAHLKQLSITTAKEFAAMTAVLPPLPKGQESSRISAVQMDTGILGKAQAWALFDRSGRFSALRLKPLDKDRAGKLMAEKMVLVLSGPIRGLESGRIALYRSGDRIRTCPDTGDGTPVRLLLVHKQTRTVLAGFDITAGDHTD